MPKTFAQRVGQFILLAAIVLAVTGCSAPAPASTPEGNITAGPEIGSVLINGVTITYERHGPMDGETVLLIAGTGNQLIDWPLELVDALVQRGYPVIRFDNRDSGLSTKLTEAGYPDMTAIDEVLQNGQPAQLPYTLEDMAEDAADLLEALKIEQAHIVGVSMGGAIAQLVAINHPERTLSLTSIAADSGNPALPLVAKPEVFAALPPPPAAEDKDAFVEYRVRLWQVLGSRGYPTDEQTIPEMVERDVQCSYDPAALARHQAASLVGHFDPQRHANLKNIKVPTVVLQGADDPLVAGEAARDIAKNIPGAELIIIPGMGHDLPTQLVPEIAAAITRAAQRVSDQKE